ncbi:ABC transporter permease [Altererythrobacter sp. CC-YST694]|uniref:ABC transporter permease n=1 Tax=Altererythrobacter sp. CC-YST694 TaxID=2755038 RepID=UPI001D015640|nr:ABC transporter permease [Altererythrobacter sp. CC-YST694]MCB5426469.1 ABC transporter permease [Altererythrobacter sp. CC-YST694]
MSPYAVKLAIRHLFAHPGQTALLMAGVALGVSVFIFMSALIGGLANLLTLRTVGSIPHIVLERPDRDPAILQVGGSAQVVLQKDLSRREQIAIWQPAIPIIENTGGVIAVSPQIRGSAFVERGQAIAPVGVIGVMPGKLSAIADIDGAIVDGSSSLPADGILIGSRLARDLGLRVGQVVRLSSDRGRARSFRIGGIFTLGIASADRQAVYMNFTAARALFDLPTGISRIEIKVRPATAAPRIAERLRQSTGLKATAWTEDNSQLFEGLDAQARTGTIIKAFSLVTIVIGIASAMLLSIVRRQSEIGIMRAMGASKGLVVSIFVLEGTLIGLVGAVVGALAAWLALLPLPPVTEVRNGGLPIDRAQGDFLMAVLLTTLAAMLASILPARNAARIDPVEAIGQ